MLLHREISGAVVTGFEFEHAHAFEQGRESPGPDHALVGHYAGYFWSEGATGAGNVQPDPLALANLAFNLCDR